ncbi:DHA2 family efflux MFS transporter permease subunit [Paramicrobacterium agarici]|uniref:DHA2 family efflux MFS transporter permease subunit n=1 Tax=Paramicrobacterium agarici TaxID=630514 RepID=UPI00114FD5C8|nr:DHA2 family efflux MFS transporter permease subunit [Microbacterium agarici]TQO23206.1 DHA2 family lincomycin resistance protein-like MFS transporter [Microbacterium agarici]
MKVIWLLLGAAFVVILNETIMSVALTDLMRDLDVSARLAQWLTTAFMLTMAVVIPITGFLLQRFTTRQVFITAMTLFSAGTALAAIAPGFWMLLGARVVQASGTAIMMPLLMTTIMTLVPPASRGKTMGNVSIVMSVAPAVGPTVSGVILDVLGWRWMFILVLPIAVAMLVVGIKFISNVNEPRKLPISIPSIIVSAIGFGSLVYGLSNIGSGDGDNPQGTPAFVWVTIAIGIVALAILVMMQKRLEKSDNALLDTRTFRSVNFSTSVVMMIVAMMGLFGTIVLLPIYLQQALHLEPLVIGLLVLPGGLLMGLMGPVVGRLYDRLGTKPLLIPGTLIVAAVLWTLALTVSETTSPFFVLGAHLVLSLGLSLLFTPLFTSSMGSVRPHLYSHASAIVGTVQQVAGAAGTALFVTVMATVSTGLIASGAAEDAAVASGVRGAFLSGAIIFSFAIIGAFLVKKPADEIPDDPQPALEADATV